MLAKTTLQNLVYLYYYNYTVFNHMHSMQYRHSEEAAVLLKFCYINGTSCISRSQLPYNPVPQDHWYPNVHPILVIPIKYYHHHGNCIFAFSPNGT